MKPSKPARWRWIKWSLILAAMVAVVWAGASAWQRHRDKQARAEIDRRLEAIRAAGSPVTIEELTVKHPSPPPEWDARLLLAPVLAQFTLSNEADELLGAGVTSLLSKPGKDDAETRAIIEDLLQSNRSVMNSVPWAKLTNSWVGAGYEHGIAGGPVYKISPLLKLAQAFFLSAMIESDPTTGTNVMGELRTGLALARTLRSDTLLHHLGRRVLERDFCNALEHVLGHQQATAEQLRELDSMLSEEDADGFCIALKAMRCVDIAMLEEIRSGPAGAFEARGLAGPDWLESAKAKLLGNLHQWSGRIYREEDFIQYLDLSERSSAAWPLPTQERFAKFADIAAEAEQHKNRQTLTATFFSYHRMAVTRAAEDLEIIARLRAARTAVAVERWRADRGGELPDSLTALLPSHLSRIPEDPFDGKPMRYRKLSTGFVIYSVGKDFTDNNGTAKSSETAEDIQHDITFIVRQ